MKRFDYSEQSIKNLIDANTKLLDSNRDLKRILEEKELLINVVINYIKANCIDDEFYINLSNKEKCIIKALNILEGKENEEDILDII